MREYLAGNIVPGILCREYCAKISVLGIFCWEYCDRNVVAGILCQEYCAKKLAVLAAAGAPLHKFRAPRGDGPVLGHSCGKMARFGAPGGCPKNVVGIL